MQRGCIQLLYLQSDHNVADVFTKPAGKTRLIKFHLLEVIRFMFVYMKLDRKWEC